MSTASSGAVFFLGTRAHYQVLQQPERYEDLENGNASTESIYQNRNQTVQDLWTKEKNKQNDMDSSGNYANGDTNWGYCENEVTADEKDRLDIGTGMKRRAKRRSSETTLCERDTEMKPALLNNTGDRKKSLEQSSESKTMESSLDLGEKETIDSSKSKPSRRRVSLLSFLASLARRKRRLDTDQIQYLQHLETALNSCTYRESCRCLECQSRYFECDESEDYSSDESEYSPRYITHVAETRDEQPSDDDDDDEVFVDSVPGDNASTDLLIEGHEKEKMSVSSDEVSEVPPEDALDIEVAAGTPVLLNYLLTHPITCSIQ